MCNVKLKLYFQEYEIDDEKIFPDIRAFEDFISAINNDSQTLEAKQVCRKQKATNNST